MAAELALGQHFHSFFAQVAASDIEIYNEFSLQHELGCYLRQVLPRGLKVQFERPAWFFGLPGKLRKREVDLSIFASPAAPEAAIELKYPLAGQYPEQMYKACEDSASLSNCVPAPSSEAISSWSPKIAYSTKVPHPAFISTSAGKRYSAAA